MVTQIMDAQHLLRVLPNISQILVAASYQLQPTTFRGCFSEVFMGSCTILLKALCLLNFGFCVVFVKIFFSNLMQCCFMIQDFFLGPKNVYFLPTF